MSQRLFSTDSTSPSLSVVVPCLNEALNLSTLCERVLAAFDALAVARRGSAELVLIDDGSTDDSWARMQVHAAADSRLTLARHPMRRGIAAAWATALEHASGDFVCTLDADLQYRPEDIALLWDALDAHGADFVQGARQLEPGTGLTRVALSRGLNHLLNFAFGTAARDNKSGFMLCRRAALAALLESRSNFRHWQCFIGVAARARGLACIEVDTPFSPRTRGRSAFGDLPLRASAEVLLDFLPAWRQYR